MTWWGPRWTRAALALTPPFRIKRRDKLISGVHYEYTLTPPHTHRLQLPLPPASPTAFPPQLFDVEADPFELADIAPGNAATVAALICGLVAFTPAVIATWSFTAAAWPWLIGSAVLELGYFLVLTYAYERFELSLVYPVARGLAPVLVLAVGTAFLGVGATALQVAGVVVVSGGVLLVRRREPGQLLGVALGALIACSIMGFTLIDREGIQHAGTIPFFWLAILPSALAGAVIRRRELRAAFDRRTFVVGTLVHVQSRPLKG